MTKRRTHSITLLALSVPMMWFGFTNFIAGGINNAALSIGVALACTLGIFFAISGLVMLVTKNSLGILNPDDKGRGEDLLASQTKVGYSPISLALNETPEDFKDSSIHLRNTSHPLVSGRPVEKTIKRLGGFIAGGNPMAKKNLTKEEKPMAKAKKFELADAVEEIRALGELIVQKEERIKKDTLAVKTATEKRAVLKDNLAKDKTVKELLAVLQESNAL